MKERPILFSAEMVRAILDDKKTQTRRPLRIQPIDIMHMMVPDQWVVLLQREPEPKGKVIACRYGVPGDRLWVRETWGIGAIDVCPKPAAYIAYKADGMKTPFDYRTDCRKIMLTSKPDVGLHSPDRWRPSIHMPRWASRITLEITGVRVERVQDITEEDALAEGVTNEMDIVWQSGDDTPVGMFGELWDSINARRGFSWDANPWVWAISFRRVEA